MDNANTIDNVYFVLSGLIAVFIYALILVVIFFILNNDKTIIMSIDTPSTINTLDVSLIDEIKPPKRQEMPSENNERKKDDNGSDTPIPGFNAAELFKTIETKKTKEVSKNEISDSRDKIAINKKGINNDDNKNIEKINSILNRTDNILNTIDNTNKSMVIVDSNVSDFCKNNYDYCKEIQNILYTNWNVKSTFVDKLSAIVSIKISKDGIFSYTITRYSGDKDFDNDLVDSLNKLKTMIFPTINNEKLNINITFTNKRG